MPLTVLQHYNFRIYVVVKDFFYRTHEICIWIFHEHTNHVFLKCSCILLAIVEYCVEMAVSITDLLSLRFSMLTHGTDDHVAASVYIKGNYLSLLWCVSNPGTITLAAPNVPDPPGTCLIRPFFPFFYDKSLNFVFEAKDTSTA